MVGAPSAGADAAGLQVQAQRSHAQCPLAGQDERSLLIDNAAQWRATLAADETQALGRAVDWRHERVLVHALAQQPTLGVRVAAVALGPQPAGASPPLGLRITRPAADSMAATALSRPCVVVAVARGGWRALRLVDADAPGRTLAQATIGTPRAAGDPIATPMPSTELMKPVAPAASK